MLTDAQQFLDQAPWLAIWPGVMIALVHARVQPARRRPARRPRPPEQPMSLLEITDLKVGFDTEDGEVHAVRDISLEPRTRRDPGAVRRVGLRQVGHRDVDPPAAAGRHHPAVRLDPARRTRAHRPARTRAARDPRQGRLGGLPGADDLAEPLVHGRLPDRRGAAPARGPVPYGGAGACRRTARAGGHPGARAAGQGVSAPALRRHAPAGDDRDRGGVLAARADRGRAHHRARRDDPGRACSTSSATCATGSAPRSS